MDHAIRNPKITVLMPVYNGEKYLREAIDSILSQAFSDFEFLIIDDGSTDESAAIIKSYKDERILYVANDGNKGLPYTLNRGLELARGEYIARMDADDISLPTRLAEQVAYMEANPEIGVCGTWVQTIGERAGHIQKYLTDPDELKANLLFNTSIAHPTVMIRKSVLDQHHLQYNAEYLHFEDYGLWIDLSKHGRLTNMPRVLLHYRLHAESVSRTHSHAQKDGAFLLRKQQLEKLDLHPSDEDMFIHHSLGAQDRTNIMTFLESEEIWLSKIMQANAVAKIYAPAALAHILYLRWKTIGEINARGGLDVWKKIVRSSLFSDNAQAKIFDNAKIFIKCLLKKK